MTAAARERPGRPPPLRPEAAWAAGRCAVLAALCALCYGNSVHGELVHDDVWAIVNNPDVRAGSGLRSIFSNDFWGKRMADNSSHKSYRPLCILTFKLNVLLGGFQPLYFHLVNVCLHAAVTCLLMLTCERCVFRSRRLAFVAALLFTVHPVHTEAVSGIVGRADVLACLLFLLTFLSYISAGAGVPEPPTSPPTAPPTASAGSLLAALVLGTCAMLVKETGVTVFGVCVLYDALVLSSYLRQSPRPPSGPGATLEPRWSHAGATLEPRWSHAGATLEPRWSPSRMLTYSFLLSFNAWLLLAPVVLCYDWQVGSIPLVESLGDARNAATLLLAAVMLALSVRCRQDSRELLVGLLFLVFPFIPASNLFFRVGFVVAERVLYMPSMGYCVLVAHGLGRLCSLLGRWGTAVLSVSLLLLLLLFSWKTVQQNHVWLSREALFRSGIQTLPHNAKVHYNYANFLKDSGRHQEAILHYTAALRLYPRHASAMNNLGTLTRSVEEAERYYRKALETNPQHNRALFNLGNLLKSQGKEKEAEALLKDSIHFGPHFADAYSSLASLYAEQKRLAEANEVYLKGIENCPDSSDLHNNYGVFLVDAGKGELAAAHYQQAVRLKPAHYVAMVNLGRLLRSSNENEEAESWYKRALQVTRKVDILTPLGALYYNTGRYEEALQVYREAAALQPDSTDIWLALAQVLAMAGRSSEAEAMTLDIISREGGCIECYRLLSAIYSKRGNYTQALDALDRALQQNPPDQTVRAELYFSKGNQLREMNQLDRAFQSYQLAVELKPDQSQAWMNMGGIQHIKGDYAAARMYYQRALLLSPGSKLLKENLAKLDRLEKRLTGGGVDHHSPH
uniref:dolichyl-phosphate-mannose--protein mannosyltransferase n=1 Tax=Salarias fasciatus TaxID=181472 RepID=A0A672IIM1_SALFA